MPTFTLRDQFLGWISTKVLTGCDVDFLLTEYSKETLESHLKNKETQKLNNTKSTGFTRLNMRIDWKPDKKQSAKKPTPYTYHTPHSSPITLLPPFFSFVLYFS